MVSADEDGSCLSAVFAFCPRCLHGVPPVPLGSSRVCFALYARGDSSPISPRGSLSQRTSHNRKPTLHSTILTGSEFGLILASSTNKRALPI